MSENQTEPQEIERDPILEELEQIWPVLPLWLRTKMTIQALLWAQVPMLEKAAVIPGLFWFWLKRVFS